MVKTRGNNYRREEKESSKQVLNIVEAGEISTLDSSIATDGFSYAALNNVMEGLYMPGPDNKPVPAAAESYKLSEDGKTYTFTLHDSKWSNGDPVTAHDFEYDAWGGPLIQKLLHTLFNGNFATFNILKTKKVATSTREKLRT